MKIHFTILICFSIILKLSFSQTVFYPVSSTTIDYKKKFNYNYSSSIDAFEISELIKIKDYKAYLSSIKKDSTKDFYLSQLPHSTVIDYKLIHKILNDKTLQDQPMPGVSWSAAHQYCTWLERKHKGKYIYNIPSLDQLLAFDDLYEKLARETLATWVMENYDESHQFHSTDTTKPIFYYFTADKDDSPALKRKVIYGNSYHLNSSIKSDKSLPGIGNANYEYMDSSSLYIGFRITRSFVKKLNSKLVLLDNNLVKFHYSDNRMNGIYEEKYDNGVTKTIGTFNNNQRIGIWSLFDSLGKLKVQRNYHTHIAFETLFPLRINPYSPNQIKNIEFAKLRNKENLYPYTYIEERSIVYLIRAWTILNTFNEEELFTKVNFEKLVSSLLISSIDWYHYGKSADFKNKISTETIKQFDIEHKSWDYSRIELKKDIYFSTDLLTLDERVIAISFFNNPTDVAPSYTLYYPMLRSTLAKINLTIDSNPTIKHLDDLFFFRYYRGEIKNIGAFYKHEIVDDWKTEVQILINEHKLWLYYQQ